MFHKNNVLVFDAEYHAARFHLIADVNQTMMWNPI